MERAESSTAISNSSRSVGEAKTVLWSESERLLASLLQTVSEAQDPLDNVSSSTRDSNVSCSTVRTKGAKTLVFGAEGLPPTAEGAEHVADIDIAAVSSLMCLIMPGT